MRKKLGPPFVMQWQLLVEIGPWLPSKFFTRCWGAILKRYSRSRQVHSCGYVKLISAAYHTPSSLSGCASRVSYRDGRFFAGEPWVALLGNVMKNSSSMGADIVFGRLWDPRVKLLRPTEPIDKQFLITVCTAASINHAFDSIFVRCDGLNLFWIPHAFHFLYLIFF